MERKSSATLHDVAREANVSIATVSHVINNSRVVKASTRARVEAAIQMIGYRHNMVARELKMGSSGLIGVLIVDYNPFYTDVLRGIEKRLETMGYKFVVASTGEQWERQRELIHLMVARRMQGILIAPVAGFDAEYVLRYVPEQCPVILFDREVSGLPSVTSETRDATKRLAEHLVDHGHRHVGMILSTDEISTMRDRQFGMEEACREFLLKLSMERTSPDDRGGYEATRKLFSRFAREDQPDVVFAANNVMLLGVLRYMKEYGFSIGKNRAVVGFDDQIWCEVFEPPITVLDQNAYGMGEAAVDLLQAALHGEAVTSKRLPVRLTIRRSCGCPME
ncbi:LacI family DNA-binding transcriptional regulator [Ferroacidibacillus organovorans]|uniref:HTH lacI-type domain-containing protein n=1 Tax=Ferroacidibacillus organovorans TaxID=1765683 RepID=A0A1V4EQI5_9BACL|nr:LacI family DNA-binding transcriptional regulator [Ferroacidibacillus organovorans]OPG15179.1 hypothetical protein B2M26_13595 [Ferroacidibacillus organovorans]